ncbi:MAG: c-type cytochrome [Planctomycetaceae bacterium]|nr:c-type cytochrome [Planctomycetaceae bacterium]
MIQRSLIRSCVALLGCVCLTFFASLQAEEIARWDFNEAESGWSPNQQTELSVKDGHLLVTSRGDDPFFSAPVKGRAGQHQLEIRARFRGRSDCQLFWTTEAEPGTSEEKSVRAEFRGDETQVRSFRLWFTTESPVTSLRIDPFNRGGRMEIDSIILSDDPEPLPEATPVEAIRVADGFRVERLYSVPGNSMGSWVSMTTDPEGRLIVSDQYGKLYRVTPPGIAGATAIQIETIDVEVGMAQGLLYAFDSLYVMVNGTNKDAQGLYRVTDKDSDDTFDTVEFLRQIDGGGEHGPHAVILSPDHKSLYVCAGNHTNPTTFDTSRVPPIYDEDQLLPRMWDAGGHAVGRMAPGGWIANVSPDGKQWELVASGFRNEYDIAFNADGELFTYDADMEWDVGSPWYRPTRVNHVTSGAEFGWRSGTGKWPVWYPDSLGSIVDIGPGSPTGITFGTGAKFPAKYQKALFINDWSYGVIYAVHMTPKGSTYIAEAERFVSAAPLPATDIVINPIDHAMYFAIGGRRTQSGLYRVTYVGSESTAAIDARATEGSDLRGLRHRLESLHHPGADKAVETAWAALGHADRNIRFAARTAIEHQPVDTWAARALGVHPNADSRITALLALARCGRPEHQIPLLTALRELEGLKLSEEQQLAVLRVISLAFIRLGAPSADVASDTAAALRNHYPSQSPALNRELCALLVYLNDASVVPKTLDLLKTAPSQEEQIHYALCLRVMKDHWTTAQREQYFQWFLTSAGLRGGNSFSGFLKNIREEAIATLSEEDKVALKEILDARPDAGEPVVEASSFPFVREWKVDDLLADVEAGLTGRDFENGRRMFMATACYKCHRFAGTGGIVGPELTSVARRYNARTMLESIIEPSKVISDQYEAMVFLLDSGHQIVGRVVNLNSDRLMVSENMLDPGRLTTIARDEIEESFVARTSMMPNGLVNNLKREDILDLVAYLQSGGDPGASQFRADAVPPSAFSSAGHTLDRIADVKERVAKGSAVLVDVREQEEWDAGHLADAVLVPLSAVRDGMVPESFTSRLPKGKPVYVHCRSGRRVLQFRQALKGQGYDIRPLNSGYQQLLEAGFKGAK